MEQLRHTRKEKSKKEGAQQFGARKDDRKKTSDASDCQGFKYNITFSFKLSLCYGHEWAPNKADCWEREHYYSNVWSESWFDLVHKREGKNKSI